MVCLSVKRLTGAAGIGGPLRRLKRRLEPAHAELDRAEHERLIALVRTSISGADCAIDVGASEGTVLAAMAAAAPHGRHLAFEPIAELANDLRGRFPTVDVQGVALSDHTGEEDFTHVVTRPGRVGLRERATPRPHLKTVRVPVAKLDELLPPNRVPKLIKVDVEGAEREVLAGAADTLARHRPMVVFEHVRGVADHFDTEPRDVWEILVDHAGLALLDLDGAGPYTLARFEQAFAGRERTNFVARAR
jgi:FkbM family methyltransferase